MSRPLIFGVVNITADSFSDGGTFLAPDAAIAHARQLVADGADAVDLGAASSHPDAAPVSPADETRRLEPVVQALTTAGVPLSIDSCAPAVQRFALAHGAAYLNDIRGFPDPELYAEIAASGCRCILMHSIQRTGQATREGTDPVQVWDGMLEFFAGRLAALAGAGIARDRILVDPGMGFFLGANPETSLHVLRRLPELRAAFGCRVLVCVSRKSFLGGLTGQTFDRRGAATLAAELYAAAHGADAIRTHDVRALRDGLTVAAALESAPADSTAAPCAGGTG